MVLSAIKHDCGIHEHNETHISGRLILKIPVITNWILWHWLKVIPDYLFSQVFFKIPRHLAASLSSATKSKPQNYGRLLFLEIKFISMGLIIVKKNTNLVNN